jgi:hypothetical protein
LMRAIAALVAALGLASCTYQSKVPNFDGARLANVGARQPGRYAVMVQSGGWDMNTEIVGLGCLVHSFKTDLNPAWDNAMRSALAAAVERADFITEPLPPAELDRQGFAGQVAIMQTNARSRVAVVPRGFTASSTSETTVEGILVVSFPGGDVKQEPLRGRGVGKSGTFTCGDAGDVVGAAGAGAVRAMVQQAVTTTKLLLAQGPIKQP